MAAGGRYKAQRLAETAALKACRKKGIENGKNDALFNGAVHYI